jgi:methyl-accepting chemotaxis protein
MLTAVVVVGLVGVVAVGIVGAFSLASAANGAHQIDRLAALSRTALEADMAHDAIRADVQRAMLAGGKGSDADSAKADLVDHQKILSDGLDAMRASWVPADVRTAAATVAPDVATYLSMSSQTMTEVLANGGISAHYADLGTAFKKVEQELPGAADAISARVAAASTAINTRRRSATTEVAVVTVVCGVLLILLSVVVARGILSGIRDVSVSLDAMAGGDLTRTARDDADNEIGRMARAFNTAARSVRDTVEALSRSVDTVTSSAQQLAKVSGQLSSSSGEVSTMADSVTNTATQVSQNVQTVAAGGGEMAESIREIARNADEAAQVGGEAVTVAEQTNATMAKLQESSAEIGNVIRVITAIAEQTNLLALNATIEAARAGEAGKGFAVVAGEVKDLAQETARATEDIARRVQAIQTDTEGAVTTIGRIGGIISRINELQTMIAAAVEEQNATTTEMNRNVTEAAGGSARIATEIATVAGAASSTTAGATTCMHAAAELTSTAEELRRLVARFRH